MNVMRACGLAAADPIEFKVSRLRRGERVRVLDLFSGCGGFSLGFQRAGFDIVAGVDIDPEAACSHTVNFHDHPIPNKKDEMKRFAMDLVDLEPRTLVEDIGGASVDTAIDVLIGGPPCQSYARVGRAKLREVAKHPRAYKVDPRGNLYLRYLEFVKQLRPLVIVMENVPDVLNYGGHNVAEETCEVLEEQGYVCAYTLLNAVFYGVPQMRERMFLIAYHNSLGVQPRHPTPSHLYTLPRGYESSRNVATKLLGNQLPLLTPSHYVPPPEASSDQLKAAVIVGKALGDLPPITAHLHGEMKRGARDLSISQPYRRGGPSIYAREMRRWPGFEALKGVTAHVIRLLPRDYKIFARMNPGDEYPQAHKLAVRMLNEHLADLREQGTRVKPGTKAYDAIRAEFVPPYDPTKFPNKWRKLAADEPSRTLMAHLSKDSYSHIHYDSDQARTISVREAARLQSFPDGFQFVGAMNAAFRQIGNAVPPLLAFRIAEAIMQDLQARKRRKG